MTTDLAEQSVSLARPGDVAENSHIELAAEFEQRQMDLIRVVAVERRIGKDLGRAVAILPEPLEYPRLRANAERGQRIAFRRQRRMCPHQGLTSPRRVPEISEQRWQVLCCVQHLQNGRRHRSGH